MAESAAAGQPGTAVVLCLLLRGAGTRREVLLGHKLRGFGHGKFVLPGGKIEPGERAVDAAVRELEEETGLVAEPADLADVATIRFTFPASPLSDMHCTVFRAAVFSGTAAPSDELEPVWHPVDRLPVEHMWDDSPRWLQPLLHGGELDAEVVLAEDNLAVARYTAGPRPGPRAPGAGPTPGPTPSTP
ncbi:MAG TPA: NUDIX domain-containing protein [Arthrobacter sp.]|nr:NUDIX domain-containing protein [Arthrobacter sp.]